MDVICYRLLYRYGVLIKISGTRVKPGALFFCLISYAVLLFLLWEDISPTSRILGNNHYGLKSYDAGRINLPEEVLFFPPEVNPGACCPRGVGLVHGINAARYEAEAVL